MNKVHELCCYLQQLHGCVGKTGDNSSDKEAKMIKEGMHIKSGCNNCLLVSINGGKSSTVVTRSKG